LEVDFPSVINQVYFAGTSGVKKYDTPLYLREHLRGGNVFTGPALVIQYDSTTVVPPDWEGCVDAVGNLVHGTKGDEMMGIHAITLEIFRCALNAIAEEMGTVLMLSSYSPNIKERRDFSCALV
jgi:5-oxoprolinase (ATP-hydrolysing)